MLHNTRFLVFLNAFSLFAVLAVNYLANALPIAGRTTGAVSDLYPTLFTPAGITFAIWGLIYLLQLGFVGYSFRFFNQPPPAFLQKIGWRYALSCAANATWLLAFHHLQMGLSMVLILLLLGALLTIYLRLSADSESSFWWVRLPFSVYLGWVTVATIANASILLTHLGWDGSPGGAPFWTVLVLVAAIGVGLWAVFSRRDYAFAGVIVWALFGIFSKRMADIGTDDAVVEMTAATGIGVMVVGVLYRLIKKG